MVDALERAYLRLCRRSGTARQRYIRRPAVQPEGLDRHRERARHKRVLCAVIAQGYGPLPVAVTTPGKDQSH